MSDSHLSDKQSSRTGSTFDLRHTTLSSKSRVFDVEDSKPLLNTFRKTFSKARARCAQWSGRVENGVAA